MERDEELKGNGNSYTTHFRQYDPRIGRWLTRDPKSKLFPDWNPYNNNENNPIINTDPRGDCVWCVGAVVGAVVGATTELAGQAIANYTAGKPLLDNIDYADVTTSAVEGAIIGATLGTSTGVVVGTKLTAAGVRISVDAQYDKVEGWDAQVIGDDKDSSKVLGDALGEGLSAAGGEVIKNLSGVEKLTNTLTEGLESQSKYVTETVFEAATTSKPVAGGSMATGNLVTDKYQQLNQTGDHAPKQEN